MKNKFWYWICKNVLIILNDKTFTIVVRWLQFARTGIPYYPLLMEKRQTFSHFLLQQKLSLDDKLSTIVADKVAVRDYVSNLVGDWILVPHFGIYEDAFEIEMNSLPDKFIIKANHGSGWNLICRDKSSITNNNNLKLLNSWLKKNAYFLSRERQYKHIKPLLLVEELICDEPNDYKFFCYQGEVKAIQVDTGRFTHHERTIFDKDWSIKNINIRYKSISSEISPPNNLSKMIEVSELLSRPFTFARIDLYENNDKVYFGEITLCPGGAFEPFRRFDDDLEMLKLILS